MPRTSRPRHLADKKGMNMRTLRYALCAAAAVFVSASAQATVTISFGDGTGGLGSGEVLYANFDSGPSSYGVISGSNYAVLTGNISGVGADPAVGGQGDPYLSVGTPNAGIASFSFAGLAGGGASQVGLDYGSADTYNSFVVYLSDGSSQTFTGQQVIDTGFANGNQSASNTNGRLTFGSNSGQVITRIDLTSSQAALEADNFGVIAAVPEPGTWGMMLLGFGAIGASLRRRRRSQPAFAQAL